MEWREFPGRQGLGSIPGWGTKIPQATQCSEKKKRGVEMGSILKTLQSLSNINPTGLFSQIQLNPVSKRIDNLLGVLPAFKDVKYVFDNVSMLFQGLGVSGGEVQAGESQTLWVSEG